MKPASFEYFSPESVDEALELLAEHGEDARPLAGGQSLVPMMNLRLVRATALVDLNRLPLDGLEIGEEVVVLGALTRHRRLLGDAALARALPLAPEVAACIAHPTVRERGTAGGSIAHADPTAELPALALLLDGEIEVRSQAGTRRIAAAEFFHGAFETALGPGELIEAVRLRRPPEPSGGCFLEAAERDGDYALAAAGVSLERSREGAIASARVVLSGAEMVPIRARATEAMLEGEALTEELARAAAAAAVEGVSAYGDVRASAAYRRHLLSVLLERALVTAHRRAAAGS